MPGLDLSQISSNWKKLQEKLQAEKPEGSDANGLKRKRSEEKKPAHAFKKTKFSEGRPVKSYKKAKMGLSWSKADKEGAKGAAYDRSNGISDGKSLETGTAKETFNQHDDDINVGLHPTHKIGKFVALDCEMVGTGPPPFLDNVLARVSLVNFHGEQIYDSYVLPPTDIEVKDYRTRYSGVTEEHLVEGYARPFTVVRKDVEDLLEGRILVGHALRNDLRVLMLKHPAPATRDTSRHPQFRIASGGKAPALRNLAKAELGISIQTGEHSSIEDARVAMLLFRQEKVEFEEESRKHFGRHAKFEVKPVVKSKAPAPLAQNGDLYEDEGFDNDVENAEYLDGEEDDDKIVDEDVLASTSTTPRGKKKQKQKKKTKRK